MGRAEPGRSGLEQGWRRFVEHVQAAPGHLAESQRREVFRLAGGGAGKDEASGRIEVDKPDRAEVPAELAAFVNAVAGGAEDVTDEEIAELRDAGHSEDQVFEAIVVAAVGAASAHLDAAHRAMGDA